MHFEHVPQVLMSSYFNTINGLMCIEIIFNILPPPDHLTLNYSIIIMARVLFDTYSWVFFLNPDNIRQEENICLEIWYIQDYAWALYESYFTNITTFWLVSCFEQIQLLAAAFENCFMTPFDGLFIKKFLVAVQIQSIWAW